MDAETELLHGILVPGHHDRRLVVGDLALRLRVDPKQVHVRPNRLQKSVKVPLKTGAEDQWSQRCCCCCCCQVKVVVVPDRHVVRNARQQVELLNSNRVDFVQYVETGNVNADNQKSR